MILSHLDMATLLMLFNDRRWQRLIIKTFSKAFNDLLRVFVPDAAAFRELMRRTRAIISGACGLWFMQGLSSDWTPDDLDVMTTGEGFAEVVKYLETDVGSTRSEQRAQPQIADWNVCSDRVRLWTGRGHVNVLQSARESALHVVPYYPSTSLMNALNADAFITPYPSPTLGGQAIVGSGHGQQDIFRAQKAMGIRAVTRGADVVDFRKGCRGSVLCGKTDRRFGDKECLMIQVGHGADEALQYWSASDVTWKLGGLGCGNNRCFLPSHEYELHTM